MLFAEFVADLPKLHCWQGVWQTGGFSAAHLTQIRSFIETHLPATSRIVETGAGNSTIGFLFCDPSRLVSIAPDAALFERIHSFCAKHSISTTALTAHAERSEWVLPEMARAGDQFDFALIDGLHNWPTSMVDFFYINAMVPRGGFIMIDDVQLHSIKELARLMTLETASFRMRADLGKSLIFEKLTDDRFLPEWSKQEYLAAMSAAHLRRGNPYDLGLRRAGAWMLATHLASPLETARRAGRKLRQLYRAANM